MPRTPIWSAPECPQHLSILDENAEFDAELAPELDDELLLRMHRCMLLARRLDERMLSLQRQGRLGTFALVKGQEAAQIGAVAALDDRDWMVPSYRETAASLYRGLPLESLLLYNAGFNEGAHIPEGAHDLPTSVPVGTQMLHAAGLAYGRRVRGQSEIVLTFFGDGATSEGDFHEAMNFASVLSCPVVFVCQNNQYAISLPVAKQTRSRTLVQKALAYDMACLQVDGNDVFAVFAACKEAADRARREHRPTLIECVTYRLSLHTTVDDPKKYRESEEVERWERREPLIRLNRHLERQGLLSAQAREQLEAEIGEQIQHAVDAAFERAKTLDDPGVIFDHLYAEPPSYLQAQRRRFESELGNGRPRRKPQTETPQDAESVRQRPMEG